MRYPINKWKDETKYLKNNKFFSKHGLVTQHCLVKNLDVSNSIKRECEVYPISVDRNLLFDAFSYGASK